MQKGVAARFGAGEAEVNLARHDALTASRPAIAQSRGAIGPICRSAAIGPEPIRG